MSIADPNKTILTGENPFIRLSLKDGDPNSTDASYWRIIFSPAGPGHVLYLKSELTEGRWRIYSDNIAMARWLQTTVQGMLNAELSDTTIPCAEATFSKAGDPRYFWTEYIKSHSEDRFGDAPSGQLHAIVLGDRHGRGVLAEGGRPMASACPATA